MSDYTGAFYSECSTIAKTIIDNGLYQSWDFGKQWTKKVAVPNLNAAYITFYPSREAKKDYYAVIEVEEHQITNTPVYYTYRYACYNQGVKQFLVPTSKKNLEGLIQFASIWMKV